jgi:hypothetical protein
MLAPTGSEEITHKYTKDYISLSNRNPGLPIGMLYGIIPGTARLHLEILQHCNRVGLYDLVNVDMGKLY